MAKKAKVSYVCKSMSVYLSDAQSDSRYCHVVLHASPIVGDEVFESMSLFIDLWEKNPRSVDSLRLIASTKGAKFTENKGGESNGSTGYKLVDDQVPVQYRNCFRELGFTPMSKTIWFKDIDPCNPIRKKMSRDGKVLGTADHAKLTWFDGAEGLAEELSYEYRYNEFLRTWVVPSVKATENDEEIEDAGQDQY